MGIHLVIMDAEEIPHIPTWGKQRAYDEGRYFSGNYKTAIGKEKAPQQVIDGDIEEEEGQASGPFF